LLAAVGGGYTSRVVIATLWASDEALPPDVRGYTLAAPDGEVGVVDADASGAGWRYLVVAESRDATARRVVVPVGVVVRVDARARVVVVRPSKAYVLDGPDMPDGEDPGADDLRSDVGAYYASILAGSAPVLPAPASPPSEGARGWRRGRRSCEWGGTWPFRDLARQIASE
jgi:hypothetical protein